MSHASPVTAALLVLALLCGCEVTLYEFRDIDEPACEKAGVARECLCPDDSWSVAACYGPDDSGPCDCVGAPPGGGLLQIAVGGAHACAVLDDGRMTCWGANPDGQLGDGTHTNHRAPIDVPDVADVVSLALGGGTQSGHSCALSGNGRTRCWGLNDQGQLGDGTTQARAKPVTLSPQDLRVIAAGVSHTCAAKRAGHVWCWGRDEAFGDEPSLATAHCGESPTEVPGIDDVVGLALGALHTCGLTGAGDALCWGEGADGQLGNGSDARRSTPRAVVGLPPTRQIVAGYAHGCALDRDGSVWCWGANEHGQLGTGDGRASRNKPAHVPRLPNVAAVAAGWRHTCALTTGGRVFCWGANEVGQLGDGTTDGRQAPTAVDGLEAVAQIAAGVATTCARTRDERLYCWGDNHAGQLGDGTDHDRHTPTAVRWQLADVDADAGSE